MNSTNNSVYIGLMSGTSLDGVDGVLVKLPEDGAAMQILASAYQPFSEAMRADAMALQQPGNNEIHHEALLANQPYVDGIICAIHRDPIKKAEQSSA